MYRLIRTVKTAVLLPLSARMAMLIIAYCAPLLFSLAAIKYYKLSFARWPVTHTFSWEEPTFLEAIKLFFLSPLSIVILFITLSYFTWSKIFRRYIPSGLFFSALIVIGIGVTKLLIATIAGGSLVDNGSSKILERIGQAPAETSFVFNILREDIWFVSAYGVFIFAVISLFRKPLHRMILSLLLLVSTLLLIISGLELAFYLNTGMAGSIEVLLYAINNLEDIGPLIASEFDATMVAAILAPLLMVGLSIFLLNRSARVGMGTANRANMDLRAGVLLWPILIILTIFPFNVEQEYYRFANNTYLKMGHDVLRSTMVATSSDRVLIDQDVGSDLANLRFVATSATRPLNVAVIMLESIRANATGIYNPELTNTPFLKSLSKQALVADKMYAVIPRTSAAWVSILQGIYPTTNTGLMWWANNIEIKNPTMPSLPKLLAKHGYKSAFFTPGNLEYEGEGQLIKNMGIDNIMDIPKHPLGTKDKHIDTTNFEKVGYFGYEDRVLLKPILSWVSEMQREENPFLLTVMTSIGHHKYELPSYWQKKEYSNNGDQDYNNYLNCIAYIDEFLKELFTGFEERGLLESTIFIILGDHGDSFGEHGTRMRAMTLYEGELHIPMLIFAAGQHPNGGKITGLRQQIDVLPTIADMLGYSIQGGTFPGTSLMKPVPSDRPLFFSAILDNMSLAMRKGPEKYIYNFGRSPMQVFDLAVDPDERHDLSKSADKSTLKHAEIEMLSWFSQSRDVLLNP